MGWALWDIFRFPRSPPPVSLQEIDNVWISSKLSRELPYVPPAPQLLFWGLAVPAVCQILWGVPQKPPPKHQGPRARVMLAPAVVLQALLRAVFWGGANKNGPAEGPRLPAPFPGGSQRGRWRGRGPETLPAAAPQPGRLCSGQGFAGCAAMGSTLTLIFPPVSSSPSTWTPSTSWFCTWPHRSLSGTSRPARRGSSSPGMGRGNSAPLFPQHGPISLLGSG